MRATDGKIHIRLFKDEYNEETWKSICNVCEISDDVNIYELKSIELTVDKAEAQIW